MILLHGSGVPKGQTASRSIFLPAAICAETIVKTAVFAWFHCFHLFMDVVSRGGGGVSCLSLVATLGATFSDFDVILVSVDGDDKRSVCIIWQLGASDRVQSTPMGCGNDF